MGLSNRKFKYQRSTNIFYHRSGRKYILQRNRIIKGRGYQRAIDESFRKIKANTNKKHCIIHNNKTTTK